MFTCCSLFSQTSPWRPIHDGTTMWLPNWSQFSCLNLCFRLDPLVSRQSEITSTVESILNVGMNLQNTQLSQPTRNSLSHTLRFRVTRRNINVRIRRALHFAASRHTFTPRDNLWTAIWTDLTRILIQIYNADNTNNSKLLLFLNTSCP